MWLPLGEYPMCIYTNIFQLQYMVYIEQEAEIFGEQLTTHIGNSCMLSLDIVSDDTQRVHNCAGETQGGFMTCELSWDISNPIKNGIKHRSTGDSRIGGLSIGSSEHLCCYPLHY